MVYTYSLFIGNQFKIIYYHISDITIEKIYIDGHITIEKGYIDGHITIEKLYIDGHITIE